MEPAKEMKKTSLDLPLDLRQKIEAIAGAEDRSLSAQVRVFLEQSASQWDASRNAQG